MFISVIMNQTYNIYCDESRVENSDSQYMVIGALFIPRNRKNVVVVDLKNLFKKHDFNYELKWTKTHKKYIAFYQDILDYFIQQEDINFRCIIVDKSKVNLKLCHGGDPEVAFFKFYYFMLRSKLLSHNKYYIFLDKKPTRDKNIVRALHYFLNSHILINKQNCSIKHFQSYDSKDNLLIQLSDFLTGLVGFGVNKVVKKTAKKEVVDYLKLKLKKNLLVSASLNEEKFNNFVWKSNKI